MSGETQPSGPDLSQGIPLTDLPDGGQVVGSSGDEAVLVVRRDDEIFAIGATCTHYGGPWARGWWWTIRYAAPGTTPVSACAPAGPEARAKESELPA